MVCSVQGRCWDTKRGLRELLMGMSRNHVLGALASPHCNPPNSSAQYVLENEDTPLQLLCAVGCSNSEGGLDG